MVRNMFHNLWLVNEGRLLSESEMYRISSMNSG
jgi:hypothetical protein